MKICEREGEKSCEIWGGEEGVGEKVRGIGLTESYETIGRLRPKSPPHTPSSQIADGQFTLNRSAHQPTPPDKGRML